MLSRWIRRIHMYCALFLMPWMLVYAISTLLLNHQEGSSLQDRYVFEREIPVADLHHKGESADDFAKKILKRAREDGAFAIEKSDLPNEMLIRRLDPVQMKRIHFNSRENFIRIEAEVWSVRNFLARLHFRKGFQHQYIQDDLWAFVVDVVLLAIVFWSLSGLWMLWEMSSTRWLGLAGVLAGILIFTFLLLTI